jgi:predicted nucleic acid-binding protein
MTVSTQWLAATALRHNIPLVTNHFPETAESTGVQIKRY